MAIYFRVHEDKHSTDPYAGHLYDKYFGPADPGDLDPSDVIYKMTPAQWEQISRFRPSAVYFLVHPDKSNRDLREGILYDDEFTPVTLADIPQGDILLLPATQDEFQVVQDWR